MNELVSSGIKYGVVVTPGFHPVGPGTTPHESVASDDWGIKGELFKTISQRPGNGVTGKTSMGDMLVVRICHPN